MRKVYAVIGDSRDHSTGCIWVVAAYLEGEAADQHVALLKEAREAVERGERAAEETHGIGSDGYFNWAEREMKEFVLDEKSKSQAGHNDPYSWATAEIHYYAVTCPMPDHVDEYMEKGGTFVWE